MPSISITKGRGSLNHNKRKYHTPNVDKERSALNRVLVDLELQSVYHELFDEAVERYNSKQERADRKIDNYLQHIRKDKKSKEFHELVVQIGNKDDMQRLDPNELAEMLQEYLADFETRNPQLKVFCAIIHMDEATPHLHLDYVGWSKDNKRGLDTRVAHDKALQQMGHSAYTGWRASELAVLENILHRNGMERTIMNNDTVHMPVKEFKKMQREVDRVTEPLQQTVKKQNSTITIQKRRIELLEEQLKHSVPKETADRLYNDNKQMKQTISKLKSDNQELKEIATNLKKSKSIDTQLKDARIHQLERENTQFKADLKKKDGLIEKLKHCIRTIIEFACEWLDISFKQFDKELFEHDEDASNTLDKVFEDEPLPIQKDYDLTR